MPKHVKQMFAEWGRQGGKMAARRLTKAQRRERAKHAVTMRELKRKGAKA